MTSSQRAVSAPQLEPHVEAAVLPGHDLVDEALLRSVHFDGHDLAGRTARLVDLEGCRLDRVTLAGTRLGKITISDCVLDGCDLANTHLTEASMFRTVLHQTRLTG
ncbi:MAG: pentapeptide repeat-containing protein, partial [Nocardioidaceae bacterium]